MESGTSGLGVCLTQLQHLLLGFEASLIQQFERVGGEHGRQ
jgi:hypothetical protein